MGKDKKPTDKNQSSDKSNPTSERSKKKWPGYVWSGCLGGIIVGCVIILGLMCWSPVHLTPTLILKPTSDSQGLTASIEQLSPNHIDAIKDLENKGVLLTPDQYTSHVSSFYSTLVAVLVGLFVVFTLLSYFITNENSSKKISEAMLEIRRDLDEQIIKALTDLMTDSQRFQEKLDASVSAFVTDDVVKKEEYDTLVKEVGKHNNNIAELFIYYVDLEERMASNEEVEIE